MHLRRRGLLAVISGILVACTAIQQASAATQASGRSTQSSHSSTQTLGSNTQGSQSSTQSSGSSSSQPAQSTTGLSTPSLANPLASTDGLTVLAVGGSVAHGWNDRHGGGYLARAMNVVGEELATPIHFINDSIGGFTPERLTTRVFNNLLKDYHPNVVIISWGLLDDISDHNSVLTFQTAVQQEVSAAVQFGAEVWIVTPPASVATFVGTARTIEPLYAQAEIQAAQSMNSNHVYIFNLLDSMKAYIQDHHESYKTYAADSWHPNTAGHILAGALLAQSIINQFSQSSLIQQ